MVKTGSQAIFLYKFPPMGLLDPLTEYLQARGGLVALWDPTDRPRTWCFSTGPGCLYPRHSLGPCCGWWALTGKWVSWQPKFWWTRCLCRFCSLHKKVCVFFFVWKESVANSVGVLWASVFLLYMVWALTSWNLQGMMSNHFQQDLSSCGLVTRFFAGSHKHQLCSPEYPLFVDSLSS